MIVIIDYGMGNLHSVFKALKRIGAEATISSKLEDIKKADKLILPGVGHFKKGMDNLRKLNIINELNKKVLEEKTPILGICLGMQLLSNFSEEGNVTGLSLIDAETKKLDVKSLKIPHMGWNNLEILKSNILLKDIKNTDLFYFVHSYNVVCSNQQDILSLTSYGQEFISSVQKNNIYGVQFHPEKSHLAGLNILKNFKKL